MTNPRTSRSFLWGAVAASVALVAAMAALLIAYYASPAQAAGGCSTTSGTTTCTFGPTGAEDTFVVPEGVSTIHVVATGAPGAVGNGGGTAGLGAQVSGDLPVARARPSTSTSGAPQQATPTTALKTLTASADSTVAGRAD